MKTITQFLRQPLMIIVVICVTYNLGWYLISTQFESNMKKLEWISPEEIDAAIVAEVGKRFSVTEEEIEVHAARALGFARTTAQMVDLLKRRVQALIRRGRLSRQASGLAVGQES